MSRYKIKTEHFIVRNARQLRPLEGRKQAVWRGFDMMRLDSNVRVRLQYEPELYDTRIKDRFDRTGMLIKQAAYKRLKNSGR